MDTTQSSIRVLMVPWLAHGHISPYLELAKRLTRRKFQIFLCSTPINLSSIKERISDQDSSNNSIQFLEFHHPSLPELPPQYHTTNGLPPLLMPALDTAVKMAVPTFSNILNTLDPDLLIYDFKFPWAHAIASSLNIPAVLFLTAAASGCSFGLHWLINPGKQFPTFLDPFFQVFRRNRPRNATESSGKDTHADAAVDLFLESIKRSDDVILIKTFSEIEGKYVNFLSETIKKKIVPVGPLVQEYSIVNQLDENNMEIIKWLDKKEKASTVFVSFGSEYYLSKEEMEELAHGLELSKVNFIWVVRFPLGDEIGAQKLLPEGFPERVGERGKLVEGWAPQSRILGHQSTGGFVSHCGWNSTVESMKFGIPIIAVPMVTDQPYNAKLVEVLGVAVEIEREKSGKLKREEIAQVIRKVLVEKSGEEVRRKSREMGESIRRKGEEEIDEVVEDLLPLCRKRNQI